MKIKKIIILENIESNELRLVFSKIVSKGLCWDKVWGISIFPSCTPIRGIYRKSLLIAGCSKRVLMYAGHMLFLTLYMRIAMSCSRRLCRVDIPAIDSD